MPDDLLTLAEISDYQRTGRTDEVAKLCAAFAAEWPDAARSFEFGRSSEGRSMQALLVTRTGHLTPQGLKSANVPVLLIQAGIHPGECDGKDAGFITLREMLRGDGASGATALSKIAILFVPAFNVDGHERMGRWNRPNQNGPEETGWRVTARNLNLNRDYTKADTPEMQALLHLVNEWDPLVCADLHVTDGADFQPDISLQAEPINQGDAQLHAGAQQLRDRVIEHLKATGSMPLSFYPDLYSTDDPASGFVLTVYSPRFSTGYFPQRNRFTLLVETHSWKDYRTRVRVTRDTIIGIVDQLAMHGGSWLQQARVADFAAARIADSDIVLDYRSSWQEPAAGTTRSNADAKDEPAATMIDFPGYAYTRVRSQISGGLVTTYDPKTLQIWHVPYRDRVEPSIVVRTPKAGYIVTAPYAQEIGDRLRTHGVRFEPLRRRFSDLAVAGFRASRVQFSQAPFEGRMRATLEGQWEPMQQTISVDALYVPVAQPLARLVVTLLEPQAPDSFAAWGFFNACFEQKEYMEPYVAEQIARDMLNGNPALRAQFEQKLHDDVAFAADPTARLQFFLRRHSSWDQRYNLYPIYRVATPPGQG